MPNPNERVKFSSEQEEIIKEYYADVPEYGECPGCRELEAKLAEAEKERDEWAACERAANERTLGAWDCEKEQRKRAEAAEARVKELEKR